MNNKQLILDKKELIRITKSNSKLKIINNIFKILESFTHTYPPFDFRNLIKGDYKFETLNTFHLLNSYMYGSCHEFVFLTGYLLKINKIKFRVIRLESKTNFRSHWSLEAYFNKKWNYLDPTLCIYFLDNDSKKILSLSEIKGKKGNLITNKPINLRKLVRYEKDQINHGFYYKNVYIFNNSKKNYMKFFNHTEIVDLKKNDYAYKKILNKKINNYCYYNELNTNFNYFKIKKTNYSYGFKFGKKIFSNKKISFNNLIFEKKIISNRINLNNFTFPIIDIRIFFNSENVFAKLYINKKSIKIKIKNKSWIFNSYKIKNIYSQPIRNFFLKSSKNFFKYEILVLSNGFNSLKH